MKRIFITLLCCLLISGCGRKSDDINTMDNNHNKNENVTQSEENNPNTSKENETTFDSYEIYLGIDRGKLGWYAKVPYLNEVNKGSVKMFTSGNDWWLAFVKDSDQTTKDLEEAKNVLFDIYFKKIEGYFIVDDNGFVENFSTNEQHSGIEMNKIEGIVNNSEYEDIGECWVYGYIFMLEDTPVGLIGMNCLDKTEEAKNTIKMYIDAMVDTLILK